MNMDISILKRLKIDYKKKMDLLRKRKNSI
jgi:hypothetical protein